MEVLIWIIVGICVGLLAGLAWPYVRLLWEYLR